MRTKINLILGSLIALLSSCKTSQKAVQTTDFIALYGVPYATYDVSGKVINEYNKPIKDATVTIKGYRNTIIGEEMTTDKDGKFHLETSAFPTDTINIVVNTHEYAADSVQYPASYQREQEGRGFYSGECKVETTITLKDPSL